MNIWREWRVIALSLVAALSVSAPLAMPVVGPLIAAAVFFASNPKSFRLDLTAIFALAIPLLGAISLIWSINPGVSIRGSLRYAALALVFVVMRHVLTTRKQLILVSVGYLVGCVALFIRLVALFLVYDPASGRLNLPDVNANYAGYSLVAGFAVIVLLWASLPHRRSVVISLIAVGLLLIAGILLADTRAALGGLAILILWLAVSRIAKRPPIRTLTGLTAAAALVVVLGIADRLSLPVESLLGRPTGDWSGRLVVWPLAREWWLDHFIVGSGVSTFAGANPMKIGAHDLVLEIGAGLGLVGVLLFLCFLFFSVFRQPPLLVGSLIAVTAASYITGHWELAPAAWVLLAIFARSELAGSPGLKPARNAQRVPVA